MRTASSVGLPRSLHETDSQTNLENLRPNRLLHFAGLVFHDIPGHGTGRDRQRRRQVHLSRAAPPGEISILSADHDLVGTGRYSRTGVDARTATGLDDLRSGLLESLQDSPCECSSRASPANRTGCKTSPIPPPSCRA